MERRTVIVSGPLALRMRRATAARDGETGVEILTLPLMAARLASGFLVPAGPELLQPAIRTGLNEAGLVELGALADLPGMARAVARTLSAVWRADISLAERSGDGSRLAELAELEARIRAHLPTCALIPPDLRDAALARIQQSARLLGEVLLDGLLDVEPVWRPLLVAIAKYTVVVWRAPTLRNAAWFPGTLQEVEPANATAPTATLCADPRAEVVEALRWVRQLLAEGRARAHEIAITATTTDAWDEHVLVLAREAGIPVHFSHGVPALDTREGQACAALADTLLRGLSQARVRRLLRRASPSGLPEDWSRGLPRGAGLYSLDEWRYALSESNTRRASGTQAELVLLPVLEQLSAGPKAAAELADQLLTGEARRLMREALRAAPAQALDVSLRALRAPDLTPAASSVAWGPAPHVAGAPRPFVRMLGLTGRSWPRPSFEDPLLPNHILPASQLEPVNRTEADLRHFKWICAAATGEVVLSRGLRSAEGSVQTPSRLWPKEAETLVRTRIPAHAFSEADRLMARPYDAAAHPRLAAGVLCWRNWGRADITAHDGIFAARHSLVEAALGRPQSSTSLRRLLRDPLAYVWRYILGWRPPNLPPQPLALEPSDFGELVHDLLSRAVTRLQPSPGLSRASSDELRVAVDLAAADMARAWAARRPVPPPLLWAHTVDRAAALSISALEFDRAAQPTTRSWTEVPFGVPEAKDEGLPWTVDAIVSLGGVSLTGRVDRLDLGARDAARVTDYKTGRQPSNPHSLVLGGGAELQRVVYAAAVRQLVADIRRVVPRLLYLADEPAAFPLPEEILDQATATTDRFIAAAADLLRAGVAHPGPQARDRFNDARIALPADLDSYFRRKGAAFQAAQRTLSALWDVA